VKAHLSHDALSLFEELDTAIHEWSGELDFEADCAAKMKIFLNIHNPEEIPSEEFVSFLKGK
jgi:hypothetical protein